jgi:hypothetical protein
MEIEICIRDWHQCEVHGTPPVRQGECCKSLSSVIQLRIGKQALKDYVRPGGVNPATNLSYSELRQLGEGIHTIPVETWAQR